MKCVYAIVNKIDGKKYIGSTIEFKERKATHLRDLRKQQHHSWRLQKVYNEVGVDNLEFVVLKEVILENLKEEEQIFLDNFKSYDPKCGYNISKNTQYVSNHGLCKPILQYTLKGDFVAEHHSMNEAARVLMRTNGLKSKRGLTDACRGDRRFSYGFLWFYKSEFSAELLDLKIKNAIKKEISEETRQRLSDSHKGKIQSEAQRLKSSLSKKGKAPKNLSSLWESNKKSIYVYNVDNTFKEQFNSLDECLAKYPGAEAFLQGRIKNPRTYKFYYSEQTFK